MYILVLTEKYISFFLLRNYETLTVREFIIPSVNIIVPGNLHDLSIINYKKIKNTV